MRKGKQSVDLLFREPSSDGAKLLGLGHGRSISCQNGLV
jgi:hypothetical protein